MSAEDDGPTSVDDASIADRVTRLVLQRLEEGVVPWRKPWHTTRQAPRPLGSRRPYRGWNRMVLSWAGFLSPCWVTAERAARRGWTPRAGAEPLPVQTLYRAGPSFPGGRPFRTRTFLVFNLQQLEGVPTRSLALPKFDDADDTGAREAAVLERASLVHPMMPRSPTRERGFHHAAYSPRRDVVMMPPLESFESPDVYYATLFHELVHATGHESRLHRSRWPGMGLWLHEYVTDYAYEELVAELGAAMLCEELGVDQDHLDATAGYVASWLEVLRNDRDMVLVASRQAAAAYEYVLGRGARAWAHSKPSDEGIQGALKEIKARGGVDALFPDR